MKRVREYLLLEIREINLLVNPFYFRSKQYFFSCWRMDDAYKNLICYNNKVFTSQDILVKF